MSHEVHPSVTLNVQVYASKGMDPSSTDPKGPPRQVAPGQGLIAMGGMWDFRRDLTLDLVVCY